MEDDMIRLGEKLLDDASIEVNLREKIWIENKKMWTVAGSAIFTTFSTFGIVVINQSFIGHLGSTELAAYALVHSVFITFGIGILLGMASALETLCGQANGAKQCHMLGLYLQRSWLVLSICAVLLLPFYIFAAPILKALGQDEAIADMAGSISLWFIPVLFSYVVSFTCQMFLQAQSKNSIIAYLSVFAVSIHLLLSWLLAVRCKLGLAGILVSTNLAYWIPNIGQLVYIFYGGCTDTWKGFSFLVFKDLWPVIKLSLSTGVTVCVEIWYNAVLVLLTGNMENAEMAIDALAICININSWGYLISLGFLNAASVRVSNELGRGSSKATKFAIVNAVLTSFAMGFVLLVFFMVFRDRLPYIYTNNADVVDAVANLSPLLACSILLNSFQLVLTGITIGAGWQITVAYVNIICYYIIGIPIGALLGYVTNLQVKGVWTGMLIGTFIQTVVLATITYKTDWDKQVEVAQKRVNKWLLEPEQPSAALEHA